MFLPGLLSKKTKATVGKTERALAFYMKKGIDRFPTPQKQGPFCLPRLIRASWEYKKDFLFCAICIGKTRSFNLMKIGHYSLDPLVRSCLERQGLVTFNMTLSSPCSILCLFFSPNKECNNLKLR